MCNKSESIKELAVALSKFNAEVPKIGKDATNPHFRNRYASLDNIIDEVKPLLAKHGLSVIQIPGGDGEKFTMTTMLVHTSGEWIESEPLVMKPVKNDPQGIGSCSTYARRYGMSAFLGLSTGEEDDDGNAASNTPQQRTPAAPYKPTTQDVGQQRLQQEQQKAAQHQTNKNTPLVSEAQVKYIHKLKADKHITDDDFKRMVAELAEGNVSVKELTKQEASALINTLNSYQPQESDSLPF